MNNIHPSAVVSPRAELGDGITIGPHAVIEESVVIGDGSSIGSSALLAPGAIIGQNVRISHGAVIGTNPQDLKFGGEITQAKIGDNTVVREYVTINRGTKAHGETSVGRDCFIMAYAHVAHDCIVGNNVILANSVNMAGHVEIHDWATIGGVVPIHQFVKIGAHCMVGGGFRVPQDICPFSLVGGYPLKVVGLNSIGLRRRGFAIDRIRILEQAFKFLFFSGLNTSQAIERINAEVEKTPDIQLVLDFVARSDRGIIK
ncbi:MAG: acyl-ACP--UDP-N-acetylglucosamine O-acyltransferase [candidate division Zixibacteria bacterium]|nr:acyl-ACP--UDP-N-acetylglucosamine O-acyltransferase [candidate division Zixibacteria bacterium]